jgi:plastocyanin
MHSTLPTFALVLLLASFITCATITITVTPQWKFSPDKATATVGDTIVFDNLGTIHNVAQTRSSSSPVRVNGGFTSGAVGTQSTYSLTITQDMVNTYGKTLYYVCEPHAFDGMTGQIAISGSTSGSDNTTTTASPTTNSTGITTIVPTRSSNKAFKSVASLGLLLVLAVVLL